MADVYLGDGVRLRTTIVQRQMGLPVPFELTDTTRETSTAWLKLRGLRAAGWLVASQYHLWSRFSSGSAFAPEPPRSVVILFNAAFGALALATPVPLALDAAAPICWILPVSGSAVPMAWRYAAALAAVMPSAVALSQAVRVPPPEDVSVAVANLLPSFDGYTILHLTDLQITRSFPASWARAVVAYAEGRGTDLIVVTGDFIAGSLAARRDDVEPLRTLRARDGVWAVPGDHEYFFDHDAWMRHLAG